MDEKYKELNELAKPLIEWLYNNGDPYTTIIVAMDLVEVTQSEAAIPQEVRD